MSAPAPAARTPLLQRLGLHRPELRAWAMYDWANSAMITIVVTAVFPPFFSAVAAANLPATTATSRFTLATTISMVLVALFSPLLGTVADYTSSKLRFLGGFLALGVVSCGLMFFIRQGDWLLALILFGVANIGAGLSFVFYDALLPHVAAPTEMDRVSTAGYALGYVGGGLLLAFVLWTIVAPATFGFPSGDGITPDQASLPARLGFLLTAIWWALFSIPLFRKVKEPAVTPRRPEDQGRSTLAVTALQLRRTLGDLVRFKQAFLLLVAFLIYNDGIGTIIRMAAIYGTELGIPRDVLIGSILLVQFVGIPCAFLFGALAERVGTKQAIFIGLMVYVGIAVLGYFMRTGRDFVLLAVLVGLVQGGTQALSRSLFAGMIPRQKSGEFFGFFSVFEKFAGILGPLVFYLMIQATGSSRSAILSVIAFFVVGGALLFRVDVTEGQRAARAAEPEVLGPA